MDTPKELTDRQSELFRWMYDETRRRGYQPSMREAGEHFGWSSSAAVFFHLRALERKGWIACHGRENRAVRFLRTPDGVRFRGFRA